MKTEVVDVRKSDYDEYVGRGTVWGNPFLIGRDGSREEVIEKYSVHIVKKLLDDPELIPVLLDMEGQRLGCFCAPRPCHADVLVKLIEDYRDFE